MTHRRTWQLRESAFARMLGSDRNSLSGGASKVSRSDSIHPRLYIECKLAKAHAVWTLLDETKPKARKEKKTPVIVLSRKGSPGFMVCVHTNDLTAFCEEWLAENSNSKNSDDSAPYSVSAPSTAIQTLPPPIALSLSQNQKTKPRRLKRPKSSK